MSKFFNNALEIAAGILVAHVIVEKWDAIQNFAALFMQP